MFNRRSLSFVVLPAVLVMSVPPLSEAVVVHDEDTTSLEHPSDAVVGRWSGSSAVAIAPRYFLASVHQRSSNQAGATATFGGSSYNVVSATQVGADVDLQVLEVDGDLPDYAPIQPSALTPSTTVAIGGYGKVRGEELSDTLGVYGYQWADNTANALTWGANQVDGGVASSLVLTEGGRTTVGYSADFDPEGSAAENAVTGEAAVAAGDSGGGWFVFDGTDWRTVAVTLGATNVAEAEAIFRTPVSGPDAEDGDLLPTRIFGANVFAYSDQINAVIPEPGTVALLGVGLGLVGLRRRRAG